MREKERRDLSWTVPYRNLFKPCIRNPETYSNDKYLVISILVVTYLLKYFITNSLKMDKKN